MPCNYCGTEINLMWKDLHVKNETMDIIPISICERCLKKYNCVLFDACDECNKLYELRVDVFQVISGKMYCPTCKEALIISTRH